MPAATKALSKKDSGASSGTVRKGYDAGLRQAGRETTMTREEWRKLQVGMAAKFPALEYKEATSAC